MEIKKVDGWVVRVPEETYQNKFTDKVRKVGDFLLNRRRPDSGTKGNFGGLHHGGKDRVTEFKNKKEEEFVRDDLSNLKTDSEPIQENSLEVDDQLLEMDNQEGNQEQQYLEKQQNSEGVVTIDDKTVFSDGSKIDGTYLDSKDLEPTVEELKAIEEEEKREKQSKRDEIDFYSDRGNMGERGKGSRFV